MGLDLNLVGWVGDRFNDLGNSARRAWQGLNGEASDYDKNTQDPKINQNTRDIETNQGQQKQRDAYQDVLIQKVQGGIKEFANQLGLDPNNLSAKSIRNRVTEITNDMKLTELSDDAKNTVRTSIALDGKQRKVLEDELNALESAWKLKYQENGSKFNLDDANSVNIVSKLLATQNFIQQIEEKNLKTDYVSGIAKTLRDTTNRINNGLRAELPTTNNDRTLVTA
jgi:hypothetical protein